MINYFDAAENTLRSRSMLEKALKNLMRRQERIMRHNSPSGYPSLDTSKPYTSTKSVNDALTDCIEIAEVARESTAQKTRSTKSTAYCSSLTRKTRNYCAYGT